MQKSDLRSSAVIVFASAWLASPHLAFAQAPAPSPAQDNLQAAARAFEALPEPERRALQDALVWTGDFNGIVNGAYGRGTRSAILSYAKKNALPPDGTLDEKARAALLTAARTAKANLGFAVTPDPRTGARLGIPQKILVKRSDVPSGSRWSAADNAVVLATISAREAEADLKARFDKETALSPLRRVTYKFMGPDFFVVSGEEQQRAFYTRMARGEGGALRGYTFTWPVGAKGNERVSIAIANSFEPFPSVSANAALAAAPSALPNAPPVPTPAVRPPAAALSAPAPAFTASAILAAPNRYLTVLAACANPAIGGRPARILRREEASGLTLLEGPASSAKSVGWDAASKASPQPVLAFYQGGDSGAETMLSPGEFLAAPARVLAPLQGQAAGGIVMDRAGNPLGIIARLQRPQRVAGIVTQAAWPMIEPGDAAAFLAAGGVTQPARVPQTASARPAADIASELRGALASVSCGP